VVTLFVVGGAAGGCGTIVLACRMPFHLDVKVDVS